jgi:hypothetical protein
MHTSSCLRLHTLSLLLALGLGVHAASAQGDADSPARFALSADFGTLGYGASTWYTFTPYLSASAGYNILSYTVDDIEVEDSGIYSADLDMKNLPILLNYHPFKGTFRLFAGGILADNKIDITGTLQNGIYEINDVTYTAAQIGTPRGRVTISDGFKGLVGLGWSKSPSAQGWGGFFEIGVIFNGAPTASLEIDGPLRNDPAVRQNIKAEIDDINKEAESYELYPLIRCGLMYRF